MSEGQDELTDSSVGVGGQPQTFERFFESEYARLVRALYLLTGDREEAQDIAQGAMVRVLERWERVRDMESRTGYLFRVAFNLNRSGIRLLTESRRASASAAGDLMDPLHTAETRSDVRRILKALPRRHREVLVLTEWLDMNDKEVARVLRTTPGAARVRLHRAREAFRRGLGERYE